MSSPDARLPAVLWARPVAATTACWGPPELRSPGRADGAPAEAEPDPLARAYEQGFAAGLAEGMSRAEAALRPAREAFATLVTTLERERQTFRRAAEENIAALAVAVAGWLFQREVTHDPAALRDLIRRGVVLLPAGAPIEIRVNPDDLELLGASLELAEPDGRPISVHWSTDPALDRGSFSLVGPERLVDGRSDVALRNLYERLLAG